MSAIRQAGMPALQHLEYAPKPKLVKSASSPQPSPPEEERERPPPGL
jgi:hypothetical protein